MQAIADRQTNPADRCAEHHVVLDYAHLYFNQSLLCEIADGRHASLVSRSTIC